MCAVVRSRSRFSRKYEINSAQCMPNMGYRPKWLEFRLPNRAVSRATAESCQPSPQAHRLRLPTRNRWGFFSMNLSIQLSMNERLLRFMCHQPKPLMSAAPKASPPSPQK